jgi:carbamoyltransferase
LRAKTESVLQLLDELGIGSRRARFVPVEHHLAHASSAYHLSGFKEKTAIVSIDGKGEYATTFFGYGENGRIHKIKEFYDPDSLGWFYGAITEYLGFEFQDGEYKVMGMAPYGDPHKYDFARLIRHDGGSFRVNTRLINVIGDRCYRANGKEYSVSPEFVRWLGPVRSGDDVDEPYIHYAVTSAHRNTCGRPSTTTSTSSAPLRWLAASRSM